MRMIFDYLLNWWGRVKFGEVKPTIKRRSRKVGYAAEETGEFFYFGDILKQLDDCNRLIRKVRKVSRDTYDWHSKVGAAIVPARTGVFKEELDAGFLTTLPSMFMLYYGSSKKGDTIPPCFGSIQKITQKTQLVENCPGAKAIYLVQIFYIHNNTTVPVSFHVAVKPSGEIVPLKEMVIEAQTLPRKFHSGGERIITGAKLDYSEWTRHWYSDNEAQRPDAIEDFLTNTFLWLANFSVRSTADTWIRAKRRGVTVCFNLTLKRAPVFFKDRNTELASDGKRKRIFHHVTQHVRKVDDKEITVKAHYRGKRRFDWGDHNITITIPEKHGNINKWTGAAVYADEHEDSDLRFIDANRAAQKFADHYENAA